MWGYPAQRGAAARGTSWGQSASLVSSVAAAAPGTSVLPSACQREELGADSRRS